MIYSLIVSLFLTLIIELTVSIIIGIRDADDIKIVALANIITNPVVVFIANIIYSLNNVALYYSVVAVLEISAVLVEAFIFKKALKYKDKKPLTISIINNVISYSLGLVINLFL